MAVAETDLGGDLFSPDLVCAGCSESRPVIFRAIRPLCGPCFEDFLLKKFMRAMRAANIKTGDAIVVGLSNGVCSAVLADLFAKSLRPRDELHVTTVYARTTGQPEFQLQLERFGWTHVDTVISSPAIANADAAYEWHRASVLGALSREACDSGSRIVLTGECAEQLATNMLSCAASGGRGLGAVERCQEVSVIEGVAFVRPLHLITMEQISVWAEYRGLHFVPASAADSKDAAVYDLTYRFLTDLQSSFPSCVSNVIRTTAKLERADPSRRCRICRDPLSDDGVRFCVGCTSSGLDLLFDKDAR